MHVPIKKTFCTATFSLALLLLLPHHTHAKPVAATELEDALSKAPIILLAESGPKEYDDLKAGDIRKAHSIQFECRKQAFKILKVYRNKTNMDLKIGTSLQINNKSNGCIDFEITIERKGAKLDVKGANGQTQIGYQLDITNNKEKVVLLLQQEYSNPKLLEHYGWFVSPEPYKSGIESQITNASYSGPKHGTHMTSSGCE